MLLEKARFLKNDIVTISRSKCSAATRAPTRSISLSESIQMVQINRLSSHFLGPSRRLKKIRSRGKVLTLWAEMTALLQGLNRSYINGSFEVMVGSYRVSTLKFRQCTAIIEKDSRGRIHFMTNRVS